MRISDWSSDVCSSDLNVPGGAVEAGTRRFNIKTSGSYHSVQQVLDTVIAGNGAQAVHVADVASVRWDAGPLDYVARFDGKRAVYVTADQKTGHNIFETKDPNDTVAADFAQHLPGGVSLQRGFDQ